MGAGPVMLAGGAAGCGNRPNAAFQLLSGRLGVCDVRPAQLQNALAALQLYVMMRARLCVVVCVVLYVSFVYSAVCERGERAASLNLWCRGAGCGVTVRGMQCVCNAHGE